MDAGPSNTRSDTVDAFILFNEQEDAVEKFVGELSALNISTYFWRRDIKTGQTWREVERNQLETARCVVLFLGSAGWGKNHLPLAKQAVALKKIILPVLIGSPPVGAVDELDGLFREKRYRDLTERDTIEQLARDIKEVASGYDNSARSKANAEPYDAAEHELWLSSVLESFSITAASPAAGEILVRAAAIKPGKSEQSEISSTRLFMAMFEFGADAVASGKHDQTDGFGARALYNSVMLRSAAADLAKAGYSAPPGQKYAVSGWRPNVTINTEAVIRAAVALSPRFGFSSTLCADALLVALLKQGKTKVADRLEKSGVTWLGLPSEVSVQLASLDPSRAELWNELLFGTGTSDIDRAASEAPIARADGPLTPTTPTPTPTLTPLPDRDHNIISFARLGNDDPSGENLDDRLGVNEEARAFARVAAARSVDPPLAFGIFGNWGAGKSFFMRLVQKHLEAIAKEAKGNDHSEFHSRIVQIRFNAWHYVESNLWASLVDHIFMELDKWVLKKLGQEKQSILFDKLSTARELTIESAEQLIERRREQKIAAAKLAEAQKQLADARIVVAGRQDIFLSVVRTALTDAKTKSDINAASKTLGLDQLAESAQAVEQTLSDLKKDSTRTRLFLSGFGHTLVRSWRLGALFLIAVVLPAALVSLQEGLASAQAIPMIAAFTANINKVVLEISGFAVSAACLLGSASQHVRRALSTLDRFRDEFDEAVDQRVAKERKQVEATQGDLARMTADVEEAHASLVKTSEAASEAARDYANGTGRGRLLRFVRDRATDGDYAKHLGLVAAVRKDFTQLSALMSKADAGVRVDAERQRQAYQARVDALITAAEPEKLLTHDDVETLRESTAKLAADPDTFERIVLYIDDLDRCPADKVIEVLQAVHLLLTFPLFVVMVAVDARWVSRALEKHYADELGGGDTPDRPVATASDYLEKVFQVPYWVRPMDNKGSQSFIESLIKPERRGAEIEDSLDFRGGPGPAPLTRPAGPNDLEKGQTHSFSAGPGATPNAQSASGPAGTIAPSSYAAEDGTGETNQGIAPRLPGADTATQQSTRTEGASSERAAPAPSVRALQLTDAECAFMTALSPFIGRTPRRALRFLNVYKVIKASFGGEELRRIEDDGGYRPLMTQLAITTSAPSLRGQWTAVLRSADPSDNPTKLISRLDDLKRPPTSLEYTDLSGALGIYVSDCQTDDDGHGEAALTVAAIRANGISELRSYATLASRYSFNP